MEKVVFKVFNHYIPKADRYTNNGSTWLIFTETKQWVIEYTEDRTLWYNYSFFNNLLSNMIDFKKEHKKKPKSEQAKLEANILLTNAISSSFKM